MIHPLSDCNNSAIPESTNIWQFCVVFPGARIGENCNICSHCLIENDVVIGNNVTVKCGVQIWDGIELEDGVMVGANTTFTGENAMIGAGSVVTKSVPAGEIWVGNPAKFLRKIDEQ